MNKSLAILILLAALLMILTATVYADGTSRPCPAPGGGYAGALNMLHDATMFTIPMARDNPNGNVGMFNAVGNSACP